MNSICKLIGTTSKNDKIQALVNQQGYFQIRQKANRDYECFRFLSTGSFESSRIINLSKISEEMFLLETKNTSYVFKIIEILAS